MGMPVAEWPLGHLPKDWRRVELEQVKEYGYSYENPRELVTLFENKVAEFTGAPYAIAVDSCTSAIFLSLLRHKEKYKSRPELWDYFLIPSHCYVSIPMAILATGSKVKFWNHEWKGFYPIGATDILDCAPRFTKGMCTIGATYCLSFQVKKILPIGKGGMILTFNKEDANWYRQASFEGRKLDQDRWQDEFDVLGYNMYMTPEDAARGLILFHKLIEKYPDGVIPDMATWKGYPDLSKAKIFQ